MRILGIDPGYAIVGWGVVEYIGNRFAPIGYGAVITEKDTPLSSALWKSTRVCRISASATSPRPSPSKKLYYQHNQTTVIGVAEARGVILLAAAQCGVPIYEYTPHAGQAGHHRLRQGREEADSGDDPHDVASGNHPQAG